MRVGRMGAGTAVAVTAVCGLSLATADPAAAATGSWRAYGSTNPVTSSSSTWHCGSTRKLDVDVFAQGCAIRSSSGGSVQAAVIVRNDRSSTYRVNAYMDLRTSTTGLGLWECDTSGVGARSWSVCFGETLTQSSAVDSVGHANGIGLEMSPKV